MSSTLPGRPCAVGRFMQGWPRLPQLFPPPNSGQPFLTTTNSRGAKRVSQRFRSSCDLAKAFVFLFLRRDIAGALMEIAPGSCALRPWCSTSLGSGPHPGRFEAR